MINSNVDFNMDKNGTQTYGKTLNYYCFLEGSMKVHI